MKIGFFLGYGPQVKLTSEGLGRYLGGLLLGFAERGIDVSIVAPAWMRTNLFSFFRELDIPQEKIRLITTRNEPVVWKLYKWLVLGSRKKRTGLRRFLGKYCEKGILFFSRTSTQNFWGYFPLYVLIAAAALLFALPSALIGLIAFLALKVINKVRRRTDHLQKGSIDQDDDDLYVKIFYVMTEVVINQLVELANRNQECDIWYVPSLFWPQVNKIKKPVVINAPDLVTSLYPAEFGDVMGADDSTRKARETLQNGKYFITYSEFIRKTTLLRDFGKKPEDVIAISHVNNTSKPYINISQERAADLNTERRYDIELSHRILNKMSCCSCSPYYAQRMCFDDVKYLFYPSQIRPHKNIVTLLKAYEYLLREHHLPLKLILTGNVHKDFEDAVSTFIYEHHLENDVLTFSGVSTATLSALYRCAELVINPSMYEGGFTFTFGEGMSVGVPSIMADEPFETDVLFPAGLREATFVADDWSDLSEKIEYWLKNREELYEKEKPLYEKLAARTPRVVAGEYIEAFEYFLQRYREEFAEKDDR